MQIKGEKNIKAKETVPNKGKKEGKKERIHTVLPLYILYILIQKHK